MWQFRISIHCTLVRSPLTSPPLTVLLTLLNMKSFSPNDKYHQYLAPSLLFPDFTSYAIIFFIYLFYYYYYYHYFNSTGVWTQGLICLLLCLLGDCWLMSWRQYFTDNFLPLAGIILTTHVYRKEDPSILVSQNGSRIQYPPDMSLFLDSLKHVCSMHEI